MEVYWKTTYAVWKSSMHVSQCEYLSLGSSGSEVKLWVFLWFSTDVIILQQQCDPVPKNVLSLRFFFFKKKKFQNSKNNLHFGSDACSIHILLVS